MELNNNGTQKKITTHNKTKLVFHLQYSFVNFKLFSRYLI